MVIEDRRSKDTVKPIGSLPLETVVQFPDDSFAMIVSHDLYRKITGYYDFSKHDIRHVLDDYVVISCNAKLVIESGDKS